MLSHKRDIYITFCHTSDRKAQETFGRGGQEDVRARLGRTGEVQCLVGMTGPPHSGIQETKVKPGYMPACTGVGHSGPTPS